MAENAPQAQKVPRAVPASGDDDGDLDPFGHPRVPLRGHYSREKCDKRREWVEKFCGHKLEQLGHWWENEGVEDCASTEKLKGNIENCIGLAKIPVGIAGPLLIHGEDIKGYVLAPFCTTEGALVASATRGATALNRAGGVYTCVSKQQMMRAPTFFCKTGAQARKLEKWIETNRPGIEHEIAQVSKHAKLTTMMPIRQSKVLHLRMNYETGDAAGQNMTTTTTWRAIKWIVQRVREEVSDIEIVEYLVEGNASGDKKVNSLNFHDVRGVTAEAEAFLSEAVLKSVLKIDAKSLMRTLNSMQQSAIRIGMMGFNINVSNTVAAIFAATGQDMACVHESSLAQLCAEEVPGGIHVSMTIPSLIIGTVGGGTMLATQRECLNIIGCSGKNRVRRLAEVIAAYALALDLSTASAIGSGQFANAHERLGRNRPENGFKQEMLTSDFFAQVFAKEGELVKWSELKVDASSSILSDMTKRELSKLVGHFGFEVTLIPKGKKEEETCRIVLKVKATDEETVNMVNKMAQGCGGKLAEKYEALKFETGFRKCHVRELAMVAMADPRFTAISPKVYFVRRDDKKEIFLYAMEYLEKVSHLNSVDAIEIWTQNDIHTALADIAAFHAIFLDKWSTIKDADWIDYPSRGRMIALKDLWLELLRHNSTEFPELWTPARALLVTRFIDNISLVWRELESAPRTLIHNDFNPRNVCLRKRDGRMRLCAYDWELATIHVPQHDVAEFLAFVLPPSASTQERLSYVEFYRVALEKESGIALDAVRFVKVFDIAAADLAVNRLALYTMAHMFKDYRFLPRVLNSHFTYLESMLSKDRFSKLVDDESGEKAKL